MLLLYGALASSLLVGGSTSDEPKAHTSQPKRMQVCNAEAKEKKLTGEARKQFMSTCLKTTAPNGAKPPQRSDPEKRTNATRPEKPRG